MCVTDGTLPMRAALVLLFPLATAVATFLALRWPRHGTRVAALATACIAATGALLALPGYLERAAPTLGTRVLPVLPPLLLTLAAVSGWSVWRPTRGRSIAAGVLAGVGLLLGLVALAAVGVKANCVA